MSRPCIPTLAHCLGLCTLVFSLGGVAHAQEPTREARLADFDALVAKLEANYAGWETKVTPQTRAALDAIVAKQRPLAGEARNDEAFLEAARGLLAFFGDRHLGIRPAAPAKPAAGATPAAQVPTTPTLTWTEESVKATLDAAATKRETLEGIWETLNGRYRLGILRTDNGVFTGAVLATQAESWTPGMIKGEFTPGPGQAVTGTWRMGDHTESKVTGKLLGDGTLAIDVAGGTILRRVHPPAPPIDVAVAARTFAWPDVFYVRLSERTAWIRMPSFAPSMLPKLNAIMAEHKAELESIENLIIDLRDNEGGSDFVYRPLTPLMYSRPIYTVHVAMKCSSDNIAFWEKSLADPEIPLNEIESLRDRIDNMRKHLGGYYVPEPSCSVDVLPEVKPLPKRVAVLIQGAGSSGEQFILEAMQSRKVTLFGKGPSAGVLDFANVGSFPLPSGRLEVGIPTSRSLRLPSFPIDPHGIAPDVRIPAEERDEIAFVQRRLET